MDLASERKKKKISQMRLARIAGVSRDRISKAECGYITLTKEETDKCLKQLRKEKDRI